MDLLTEGLTEMRGLYREQHSNSTNLLVIIVQSSPRLFVRGVQMQISQEQLAMSNKCCPAVPQVRAGGQVPVHPAQCPDITLAA
jgi:hypothetical protein